MRQRSPPSLPRQHLLEPPGDDVGEGEEPQRLPGRGAVDHHAVEVVRLVVALDPEQRKELSIPGGTVVGRDRPRPARRAGLRASPGRRPSGAPSRAEPAPPGRRGLAERRGLSAQSDLERVGEAVRRIGRENHRPAPGGGAATSRGRSHARLPDAALPGVQDDARRHRGAILRLRRDSTSITPKSRSLRPAPVRELLCGQPHRVEPGAGGVHSIAPRPRRRLEMSSWRTSRPPPKTFTSTCDSFETRKRIAVSSPAVASSGPLNVSSGGSTW